MTKWWSTVPYVLKEFYFHFNFANQYALLWAPNAYRDMLMRIFTPWLLFKCVFTNFQCVITLLRALSVALLKCEWLKCFFDLTQKYFILTANFTWNKRKPYICICVYICCAFTWPKNTYMYKIHICKCKYTPGLSRCIFTRSLYLHMCKLTFTYMQLRSYAQKYTRVQIIHICIIYTPYVNQRMWTELNYMYLSIALAITWRDLKTTAQWCAP